MALLIDPKNRILSRISVAARTALAYPSKVPLWQFVGMRLSIRARARIALVMAFLIALPILFVSVMRTEDVAQHATRLSDFDDYWKRLLETRIALKELDLSMWAYSVENAYENSQDVLQAVDIFKLAIQEMAKYKPNDFDPRVNLEKPSAKLESMVEHAIASKGSIAPARLSLMSLTKELAMIERDVIDNAREERRKAFGALSMVGRDQLILFLALLLSIPIFVFFVPTWLVLPLTRLRQISYLVESGRLKEMPTAGKDEIASLARVLKGFFLRKEDLDQKKSSKIFEMRNVLRSVLQRVSQPVFIIDFSGKINYTNEASATLVGLPAHQIEGKLLSDCLYSSALKKNIEKAFDGDISEMALAVTIETKDGRVHEIKSKIGIVRNRDGDIAKAVVVLIDENDTLTNPSSELLS